MLAGITSMFLLFIKYCILSGKKMNNVSKNPNGNEERIHAAKLDEK